MDKLEHNIKKAFEKSDKKTSLLGKEAMWDRLDSSMGKIIKVAVWWRVAAIFLALILAGGVFAGLRYWAQQMRQIGELEIQNTQLQQTVDSLRSLPPVIKTETKLVEKLVYRDRMILQTKVNDDGKWQEKYQQSQDSMETILVIQENNHKNELEKLSAELSVVREELTALQQLNQATEDEPFRLKSERVELGLQKKPAVNNPEMEFKIFPRNFSDKKNDLNRTLFKK